MSDEMVRVRMETNYDGPSSVVTEDEASDYEKKNYIFVAVDCAMVLAVKEAEKVYTAAVGSVSAAYSAGVEQYWKEHPEEYQEMLRRPRCISSCA